MENKIGGNGQMQFDDYILVDKDHEYMCYKSKVEKVIFGKTVDGDDYEINVAIEFKDQINTNMVLDSYLKWLERCVDIVASYMEEVYGESLPDHWKESIEVYSVSITYNSEDDYGATIAFGESIFPDHIIELDFEKEEIIDNRLNG